MAIEMCAPVFNYTADGMYTQIGIWMMMSQRVASVSPMWNRSLSIVCLALNEKETLSVCRRANTTPPHTPRRLILSVVCAYTLTHATANTNTYIWPNGAPREIFLVLTGRNVLVGNRLPLCLTLQSHNTQHTPATHTHTRTIKWYEAMLSAKYNTVNVPSLLMYSRSMFSLSPSWSSSFDGPMFRETTTAMTKCVSRANFHSFLHLFSVFCCPSSRYKRAEDVKEFKMARFVYINSQMIWLQWR